MDQLSDEQAELLGFIQQYIETNDERPSYSKCWRDERSPFGSERTQRVLDELASADAITRETVSRYGNETSVYGIN